MQTSRLDLDDRVIWAGGGHAQLPLAPGSQAARRRGERAGVRRVGPRLRLRRPEEGRGAGRAHDRGQPGAPYMVRQGPLRYGLQGAILRGRAGAHLVGGRCRGRPRRRRVRDLRLLLPRGAQGWGGQRLQGRPARVLHYPPGYGADNDLRRDEDGPLPHRGTERRPGVGRHRPGAGPRERGGPLRVAQPGSRRRRGVLPRGTG